MKGHTKEGCYEIIGYPQDFKNKKNDAYNVHVENLNPNLAGMDDRKGDIPKAMKKRDWQRAPQLTADQYDQIMKLLNKDNPKGAMANMAGTTYSFMAKVSKGNWIVDTGATNFMVADLGMLTNVKNIIPTRDKRVHLPNGERTIVSHVGNYKITKTREMQDVLYVPEFAYNLLYLSKITRDLHCFVSFYPDFCYSMTSQVGK